MNTIKHYVYKPPRAMDLSGLSANGQEPQGYCANGTDPTITFCRDGGAPAQGGTSCSEGGFPSGGACIPLGGLPQLGLCEAGSAVAHGCISGPNVRSY